MSEAPPLLAIIGGGFSGTCLALQALAAMPERPVVMFEPANPGLGLAYATPDPRHLLNVPAGSMSLFPDQPADFTDWLATQPDAPPSPAEGGPVFAPRCLYGRYLRDRLAEAGSGLTHRDEAVTALLPRPGGGFVLQTATGEHLASHVALAVGGFAVAEPATPPFFGNPWDPAAVQNLDPEAPVLLVGLGLTAVDMLLSLRGQGHRGPVLGISRHGWAPLAHRPGAPPPAWPVPLEQGPGPLAALRIVRAELAKALPSGVPWQAVLDGVRPHVQRLWRGWSVAEKRRVLRHLRAAWAVHRHRVAPEIGAFLAAERDAGRFEVMPGRLADWHPEDQGAEVVIRRRGGGEERRQVARIIRCVGPDGASSWRGSEPVAGMLRSGLLAEDAVGLGLRAEADGQLLSATGEAVPGLVAIGPLTRGLLWEVTAVPEIRAQVAAALARPLSSFRFQFN
ncbi:FAD/NAD(P)-binding protein [Pseudoroseomonas globiformis]|uniref:FAD/NAD(P)-binding protein n=1 Tax=Teichococcus globiformis TaxID=2307229 RepID=A0ABV7FUB5_9PROT